MFWMIPAMAAMGAIGGAVKHHSDKKQREELIDQRNRERAFAAFTGNMPEGPTPEKPSGFRSIFGGGVAGANMGLGLASGIQDLQLGQTVMKGMNSTQGMNSMPANIYQQGGDVYERSLNQFVKNNPYRFNKIPYMGGV